MEKIKAWHVVLGMILLIVSSCVGVGKFLYAFDQKKADKVEVIALSATVQRGFIEINRDNLQRQIYGIEDRFKCGPLYGNSCYMIIKDKAIRDAYQKLQTDLSKMNERINRLGK